MPQYLNNWQQSIKHGSIQIEDILIKMGRSYLTSPAFTNDLSHIPNPASNINAVIIALEKDMADDKICLTKNVGRGMANYLNEIFGAKGSWSGDEDAEEFSDLDYVVEDHLIP